MEGEICTGAHRRAHADRLTEERAHIRVVRSDTLIGRSPIQAGSIEICPITGRIGEGGDVIDGEILVATVGLRSKTGDCKTWTDRAELVKGIVPDTPMN